MHLDTVITMCDRDLVTCSVIGGARTWATRPGQSADDLVVEEQRGSLPVGWRSPRRGEDEHHRRQEIELIIEKTSSRTRSASEVAAHAGVPVYASGS